MTTAAGFIALRSQFADQMQVCLEASQGRKQLEMAPLKASFVGVTTSELEKKTAMDQVSAPLSFLALRVRVSDLLIFTLIEL